MLAFQSRPVRKWIVISMRLSRPIMYEYIKRRVNFGNRTVLSNFPVEISIDFSLMLSVFLGVVVDSVESTNSDKGCSICMGYNRTLLTVRRRRSKAAENTSCTVKCQNIAFVTYLIGRSSSNLHSLQCTSVIPYTQVWIWKDLKEKSASGKIYYSSKLCGKCGDPGPKVLMKSTVISSFQFCARSIKGLI
jgi:hypothetical protein